MRLLARGARPPRGALDFDSAYREQRGQVYAYVAGVLGDRQAAEDVTAQAFVKAWRHRDRYDPSAGTPRQWLFTIARNTALDELRRRKLRPEPVDAAGYQAQAVSSVPDHAQAVADRDLVARALRELPEADRELVCLRYWADLPHDEIAAVCGMSATNVATRLSRVMNRLREALKEQKAA